MLTNRAPFDYVYLSERLLTDLFRHERATRSRWTGSFDLNLHVLNIHLQRQVPDYTNLHYLAMRSLDLVSDYCGGIGTSDVYVNDRLELRHGVFSPLMGWRDGQIACYQGEAETPDGQTVFVALFGSASNVIGRRPKDDNLDYYPSDVAGLYTLLDAARERRDLEIDLSYRWDDSTLSNAARAETAVKFAHGGATGEPRLLDFLARVFLEVEDYNFAGNAYDKVLVGAPLWIATPKPQALRTTPPGDKHRANDGHSAGRGSILDL
jgi:hypothetical protein